MSDEQLDADYAEPRVYELGFHIDPELPSEEVKKTYQAIRETIAAAGSIIAEGEPEKIQLAYTISRQDTTGRRDFNSGFFSWIVYEAIGTGHDAVLEMAKEESRIIRYIDLRTTKDAAKHSAEMDELRKQAPEVPEDADEVSEVELDAALKEAGVA